MSAFHERSWASRFGAMGDEAEGVFEAVYGKGFVRWGLQRPDIQVGNLPVVIRCAPDYLTSSEFVEVQGFGSRQVIRIKDEKLQACQYHAEKWPVSFFFWDSHKSRYCYATLVSVIEAALISKREMYADSGKWVSLVKPASLGDVVWVPHTKAADVIA